MTDQPQGPAEPTREEADAVHPAAVPPPPPAVPPAHPAGPNPPAPQGSYVPAQQPQVPASANPYGGYAAAPAFAGSSQAYPGTIGYVEQRFGKVADFGQRALAYLIDFALALIGFVPMIIGIILLTVAVPSDISYDQFGNRTTTGGNPGLALAGGLLIALGGLVAVVISIWNRVFKMGRTGQSVGKKAVGLYLLDDRTGLPIGAGMAFLRELVNGLVNQVLYIGWLWMLWDADKQTLGDKAVHSTVVVVPKS